MNVGHVQRTMARIDALSLRERALVVLGAFMVLFLLWDALLMRGIAERSEQLRGDIDTVQSRVQQLNQSIAAMAEARGGDPNIALQDELAALRTQLADIDAGLQARSGSVIPPAQMARVLEAVLARQGRLRLLAARSLAPEALFEATVDEPAGTVYRHGFELEVEGRYLDVLEYLRALEALEWQFFWEALALQATEYPVNRVRIRVYSLNLEEGWLGV